MNDKILALLETQFPGVRKDGLKHLATSLALTVSTDEEATTVVGKLTADNVNKFITDWRKEADAEIDKANKTREANLRAKYDFVEKTETPPTPPHETPPTPTPGGTFKMEDIQKMIVDSVKAATSGIQSELAAFKGSAVSATRREQVLKVFNDQTPAPFKEAILEGFDARTFENDEAFQQYLTKTKESVSQLTQELADKGLGSHERPILGKPNKDGVSSGVEDYLEAKAKEASGEAGLTGKKIL